MTLTGSPQLLNEALIVGAQGFLGSHLKTKLISLGIEVFCISRKDGDLTQIETWEKLNFSGGRLTAVFFCAEDTGNQRYFSERDPFDVWSNNVLIIQNLTRYLEKVQNPCHVFVFGSLWTSIVDKRVIDEDDLFQLDKGSPIISLQLTKIALLSFVRKINANTIHSAQIITPGTLYGPYDNSDHLIPSVIRQAMNKKGSILMSGTGDGIRNFIYIDDFSDLLLLLIKNKLFHYESIIATSDVNLDIKAVVNHVAVEFDVDNVFWGEQKPVYETRSPSTNLLKSMHVEFQTFEFRSPSDFSKSDFQGWHSS